MRNIEVVAAVTPASTAGAQGSPTRDIARVVAWGAGGGTDTIGRMITAEVETHLPVAISAGSRSGGVGDCHGAIRRPSRALRDVTGSDAVSKRPRANQDDSSGASGDSAHEGPFAPVMRELGVVG